MESISYESWVAISNSPQFLVISGIFFFLPFVIYLILGATIKGRSYSGKTTSEPMMMYPNFYYSILIYDLLGLVIYIPTIVYPIWLLIF